MPELLGHGGFAGGGQVEGGDGVLDIVAVDGGDGRHITPLERTQVEGQRSTKKKGPQPF